jgi:hypothetical protein
VVSKACGGIFSKRLAIGESTFILKVVQSQALKLARVKRRKDGSDKTAVHPAQKPEISDLREQYSGILANVLIVLVAMQRRQIEISDIGHPAEHIPRLEVNLCQTPLVEVQPYQRPCKGLDIFCKLRLVDHAAKEGSLARDQISWPELAIVVCMYQR